MVFPKLYYPTRKSIASNYVNMFDFAATQFRIDTKDTITELKQFFVLTRAQY